MSDVSTTRPSSTSGITRLHPPTARPSFMKEDVGRSDVLIFTNVPSTPSVEPDTLDVNPLGSNVEKVSSIKEMDQSLSLLQMRIRHDFREEMQPLLVISEELRNLSSQILSSQQSPELQETGYRPNRREGMLQRLERNPTVNTDWFIPQEGLPKAGGRSSIFRDLDGDSNNNNDIISNNNSNNNSNSNNNRTNSVWEDMGKDASDLSPRGGGRLRGAATARVGLPGSIDTALDEVCNEELPAIKVHSSHPIRRAGTTSGLGNHRPGVTIYNPEGEGHSLKGTRTLSCQDLTREQRLQRFVRGTSFDYISGALVLLNAITLGLQTDWQARHVTSETPPVFRTIEVFFCITFTLEVVLRALGYRWEFFARQHVLWHLFDCFLVATQILEEVMRLIVPDNDANEKSSVTSNLSVLRVVRILRLIRVMRLMRILRLIGELRTLVSSIVGSLRSLIWAVALLFLMMYVMGVYLTQLILDHRILHAAETDTEDMILLVHHYGSLGDTVLSVYMSIFGGVDWGDILSPLRNQISIFLVPFFMFYIAFATLCMLNVITGVFVESALLTAKRDQDSYMLGTVQMVFDSYDLDKNGRMSFPEFQKSLDSMDMQQVLSQLEIDPSQAPILFQLLDKDQEGSISAKDFVIGCARLKGPAKALDLAVLMYESDNQRAEILGKVNELQNRLGRVLKTQDPSSPTCASHATPLRKAPIREDDVATEASCLEAVLVPSGSIGLEEV